MLRDRQNARYDAVVESAPDPILTLNTDGVIQMANPAAGRQFRCRAGNSPASRSAALHPRSKSPGRRSGPPCSAGRRHRGPVELMARRKDGTPTFLEVSASAWQSDQRTFVTAIFRDINERRAAEEALRRLNQTLEQRVAERTADRDRMWRLTTDVMLVAHLRRHDRLGQSGMEVVTWLG